ncbi:hypothetical protein GQR58_014934 [Nymphon striatum]|nr:hypothetical protein GQR58_014934 [Nymphon striatum]
MEENIKVLSESPTQILKDLAKGYTRGSSTGTRGKYSEKSRREEPAFMGDLLTSLDDGNGILRKREVQDEDFGHSGNTYLTPFFEFLQLPHFHLFHFATILNEQMRCSLPSLYHFWSNNVDSFCSSRNYAANGYGLSKFSFNENVSSPKKTKGKYFCVPGTLHGRGKSKFFKSESDDLAKNNHFLDHCKRSTPTNTKGKYVCVPGTQHGSGKSKFFKSGSEDSEKTTPSLPRPLCPHLHSKYVLAWEFPLVKYLWTSPHFVAVNVKYSVGGSHIEMVLARRQNSVNKEPKRKQGANWFCPQKEEEEIISPHQPDNKSSLSLLPLKPPLL